MMLLQTTTHQLDTTHLAQWDDAPTCFYQSFPQNWQLLLEYCRVSYCGSKHRLRPSVCLNHAVFSIYMISKKPYVKLSKYVDKLLVVKTLINIRHFSWKYLTLQLKYYPNRIYYITHFSWNENYDLSTAWFFAIHLQSIFSFQ